MLIDRLECIFCTILVNSSYNHPYRAELNVFKQTLEDWLPLDPVNFPLKSVEETYHLVETFEQFEKTMNIFSQYYEFGIDLEVSVMKNE